MTWLSDFGRRSSQRGFTLIEALIAVAILALLVGSALAGMSWVLDQSVARTERAWLIELARSVIDEYQVTRDAGLARGRFPPDLEWRLTRVDAAPGLVEATVSAWREGREDRSVSLRVLLREDGP